MTAQSHVAVSLPGEAAKVSGTVLDDRRHLDGSAPAILLVEDDLDFSKVLLDVVRELGMKGVVVGRAREVLQMASDLKIDAISFDIGLSDMDGWSLLDRLKHEPATRHIPVHILSVQEQLGRGLSMGICGFTKRPAERAELVASYRRLKDLVERPERRLLIINGAAGPAGTTVLLEKLPRTQAHFAAHGQAAREVEAVRPDCIVVDLSQAPAQGIRALRALEHTKAEHIPPVVVLVPKKISAKNAAALQEETGRLNKRVVEDGPELLDAVTLFLHIPMQELPVDIRDLVEKVARTDSALAGAKVAIIDDDIRNIFSLTSVLEQYDVEVRHAEDGLGGIDLVRGHPDLDVVLVDIMMPEIDGYETIRRIRQLGGRMAELPLIAVTAKAMKGDRQKCLDAGASDYLAKPVDPDQLISKVRTWLHRVRDVAA